MVMNTIGQIFGFIGSLCLLLFGMNMLSDGIQKGAGSNLSKLIGKITGNRINAVLTGIGVTAIIPSSGDLDYRGTEGESGKPGIYSCRPTVDHCNAFDGSDSCAYCRTSYKTGRSESCQQSERIFTKYSF